MEPNTQPGGIPPTPEPQLPPMQPVGTAPVQQPQPEPAGKFDFIMNPAPAPKKPVLGGNKALMLLAIIGGGGLVLAILAVILTSVFAKGDNSASLTSLAQTQQEIIRIAAMGEKGAETENIRGLAYNVDLSVSTSQSQLLSYMSTHSTKPKAKELALGKDTKTDSLLANAQATSTYDSALQKVLATELESYMTDVQTAYKGAKSTQLKQILNDSYNAAEALLAQANGTAGT